MAKKWQANDKQMIDPWELISEQIEARDFGNSKVYIPQPEPSEALYEILKKSGPSNFEIYQSFRTYFNQFVAKGYKSKSTPTIAEWERIYFVPTRQRIESLGLLGQSLLSLAPNGILLFACANTQGAKGFLSALREAVPALVADSGNKCRFCEIHKTQVEKPKVLETWVNEAGFSEISGTEFQSLPGIYGWNKIDEGSKLLVESLPKLSGVGADFGSGYGYLSREILKSNPEINALHLLEAEFRAIQCAETNLAPWIEKCHFHWRDLCSNEIKNELPRFDFIVMNPPFHEGRETDSNLGKSFIESAAANLKKGGKLFLVANAFLAYEKTLTSHFKKHAKVFESKSFKVIHAER